MPVINGKVVRARYTSLKIGELSSVDRPAQEGAKALIMKRDVSADDHADTLATIEKYIGIEDGAHSFGDVLRANKFSEQIWPYTDALSQSIRSIVGDKSLAGSEREERITKSVREFLDAVRSISPETEKQLAELVNKREASMSKTIEQLEAENTALKARLEDAQKAASDAKADRDAMDEECKTAKADLATAKAELAKANDETITVGGQELRKSEVGDANFAVAKALRDERDLAKFEKRADAEFGHVPGTTAEKAELLKAIEAMPDEAKKAAEAILTAHEKMVAAGFERLGTGALPLTATEKAATDGFNAKVQEIAKRDNIPLSSAMSKARREFPEDFAAMNGAAN